MTNSKFKLKIKKGDIVRVITGDYRGVEGEILEVFPERNRVLIQDVNLVKKHMKPTNNSQGGIVEQPAPIHISNVMLVEGAEATRVGRREEDGKLVRYSKKSGQTL